MDITPPHLKKQPQAAAPIFPSRGRSGRLQVPARDNVGPILTPPPSSQQPSPFTPPTQPTTIVPKDLAAERERLGFDDIPISPMGTGQSFRQIFGAWLKQSLQHSSLEGKQQRASQYIKERKFLSWKDDLKWALKADLMDDDPDETSPHPQPTQPITPPPQSSVTRSPHPAATASVAEPTAKAIDINISIGSLPALPKLSAIARRLPLGWISRFSRKQLTIGGTIAIVMISGFMWHNSTSSTPRVSVATIDTKTVSKPDYATVLPANKTITDLGGWTRVSPPDRNPVFAYGDKIGNTEISVSQQPLPDQLKSGSDGLAALATSFSATEKVTVGDNTIAYIGTSSKGPQSVILAKNNLLILIKSSSKIDPNSWVAYINSLQ